MQRIRTERHGDIYIAGKSWSEQRREGDITIGLLVKGGYVYLPGGEPVHKREDLLIITPEAEQMRALNWFDNKDQPTLEETPRRIVQNQDGSYEFDDGSPIETWEELLAYYKKSPPADVTNWLGQKIAAKEKQATDEHVAVSAATSFVPSGKRQGPVPIDKDPTTGELVIIE